MWKEEHSSLTHRYNSAESSSEVSFALLLNKLPSVWKHLFRWGLKHVDWQKWSFTSCREWPCVNPLIMWPSDGVDSCFFRFSVVCFISGNTGSLLQYKKLEWVRHYTRLNRNQCMSITGTRYDSLPINALTFNPEVSFFKFGLHQYTSTAPLTRSQCMHAVSPKHYCDKKTSLRDKTLGQRTKIIVHMFGCVNLFLKL